MIFQINHKDTGSKARAGSIKTDHGTINTPVFMPVGTLANVKGIHQRELSEDLKTQIILSNTYHLYLRPNIEVIQEAGGLHRFMNWKHNILTDSGGYQVYSLASRRKITEKGVTFKNHINGSLHFMSPESCMNIQRNIGADIIMALDECTPYPCTQEYAKESLNLTHKWLDRCIDNHKNNPPLYNHNQYLLPIVQGSTFKNLRIQSSEYIAKKNCPANAIGGLSVGEPAEILYEMTESVCDVLPIDKPRYLMGVGTPINLLECIALGVDMFDCVMPTRNGRNGMLFTSEGIINIKNKKWEKDYSNLDEKNHSFVDFTYSKAYLRHLFISNEILGKQIASIHNIGFYLWLMKTAQTKIQEHNFVVWKNQMIKKLNTRL